MILVLLAALALQESPTVGLPTRIDGLVLEGSELEAKPLDDPRAKVVLRIERVHRHGTAHRYDLVYFGLEPGTYDLREWLRRKDGSSMDGVAAIPITVRAAYAGPLKEVNEQTPGPVGLSGGYRTALIALGVAWVLGFVALVATRRRKPAPPAAVVQRSLADQLKDYVEKAARGSLSRDDQAALERLLLSFWRKREGLEGLEVADALIELRRREVPGAILRALEEWLHRPGPPRDVDVAALIEPYRAEPEVKQPV